MAGSRAVHSSGGRPRYVADKGVGLVRAFLALLLLVALSGCAAWPGRSEPPAEAAKAPEVPTPSGGTTPPPFDNTTESKESPIPKTPSPEVRLDPPEVLQGDLTILRLRAVPEGAEAKVDELAEQPQIFPLFGEQVAFIGVPAAARPGEYPVEVRWPGGEWLGKLNVVRKSFTEDRLVVTEEQTAIYYDPRQAEEWRRLNLLRRQSHPEPLWRGAFAVPLSGTLKVTTYFGEIRFVNGVETGRHSGMDFGVPTGTPILAPARGRVLMAERLIVTGWTILIDHGMGLFTLYFHCDSVDVKPGDLVESGDQIGRVGSTGFSTGPHLHWTASIGNVPVDPWPLTQRPPLGLWPIDEVLPELQR